MRKGLLPTSVVTLGLYLVGTIAAKPQEKAAPAADQGILDMVVAGEAGPF